MKGGRQTYNKSRSSEIRNETIEQMVLSDELISDELITYGDGNESAVAEKKCQADYAEGGVQARIVQLGEDTDTERSAARQAAQHRQLLEQELASRWGDCERESGEQDTKMNRDRMEAGVRSQEEGLGQQGLCVSGHGSGWHQARSGVSGDGSGAFEGGTKKEQEVEEQEEEQEEEQAEEQAEEQEEKQEERELLERQEQNRLQREVEQQQEHEERAAQNKVRDDLRTYWQQWQENELLQWRQAHMTGSFHEFIHDVYPENIRLDADGNVEWLDKRLSHLEATFERMDPSTAVAHELKHPPIPFASEVASEVEKCVEDDQRRPM
jgi:hypothetical protein